MQPNLDAVVYEGARVRPLRYPLESGVDDTDLKRMDNAESLTDVFWEESGSDSIPHLSSVLQAQEFRGGEEGTGGDLGPGLGRGSAVLHAGLLKLFTFLHVLGRGLLAGLGLGEGAEEGETDGK